MPDKLTMCKPSLVARGYDCCGKPKGCTNTNERCAYLNHPYKLWVRGEITKEEMEVRLGIVRVG